MSVPSIPILLSARMGVQTTYHNMDPSPPPPREALQFSKLNEFYVELNCADSAEDVKRRHSLFNFDERRNLLRLANQLFKQQDSCNKLAKVVKRNYISFDDVDIVEGLFERRSNTNAERTHATLSSFVSQRSATHVCELGRSKDGSLHPIVHPPVPPTPTTTTPPSPTDVSSDNAAPPTHVLIQVSTSPRDAPHDLFQLAKGYYLTAKIRDIAESTFTPLPILCIYGGDIGRAQHVTKKLHNLVCGGHPSGRYDLELEAYLRRTIILYVPITTAHERIMREMKEEMRIRDAEMRAEMRVYIDNRIVAITGPGAMEGRGTLIPPPSTSSSTSD